MAGSRRLAELRSLTLDAIGSELGNDGPPLLIALSGGADSAVLAWAVTELGGTARSVYVHHGWPASDRMAEAAAAVAARLELSHDQVAVATDRIGSPEAVAREERYAALSNARAHDELVATGHTLTDQAETVIGNLMWGSGLDGLGGIHSRRGALVRPMLGLARSDIRELAELLALPFSDDLANDETTYRRVRIRRALAAWEGDLAPGISTRLAEMAELARSGSELLEDMTSWVRIEEAGHAVRIPIGPLRSLPDDLARRVLRRALRRLNAGHPGSRADVEAIIATATTGTASEVSGGHRVERVGTMVQIGVATQEARGPFDWDFKQPLSWGNWRFEVEHKVGRPATFPLSSWRQVFDAKLFDGDEHVIVRSPVIGDALAMTAGHKSAVEAMAEAGIHSAERGSWPAVALGGTILWIPGVRRSYAGWVTDATEHYLVLSAVQEERWKPLGS